MLPEILIRLALAARLRSSTSLIAHASLGNIEIGLEEQRNAKRSVACLRFFPPGDYAISALHAGIIFGLADFCTLFREWVKSALGARPPADILVVIAAISGLFVAHIAEAGMWAAFFWKSGHLASFSDGWYFAGVSHTTLGYDDVVLPKPWRSLGAISAINGLLTFGCSTAFLFLVLQIIWQHPLKS